MKAPEPPRELGELTPGSPQLEDRGVYRQLQIEDLDWSNVSARSVEVEQVVANRLLLTGTKLVKVVISDCRLGNSELSAANLSEGSLLRCVISLSRGSALDLSGAMITDVVFEGCKLNLANFRQAELKNVVFKSCDLAGTDFASARLESVMFADCDLSEADLSNVKCKEVDLRSSVLAKIRGVSALKGATISRLQLSMLADYLAADIGLIVEDN